MAQGLQENKKLYKMRAYFDVCPFSETFFDELVNTYISLSQAGVALGGEGVFHPLPNYLLLKLDHSNFVQNYFGIMYQSIPNLTIPQGFAH